MSFANAPTKRRFVAVLAVPALVAVGALAAPNALAATGVFSTPAAPAGVGALAPPAPGDLVLVSASGAGEPSNGSSAYGLSLADGGRYVAFASMASNLTPSDPDTVVDVFVKDLITGEIQLASQNTAGVKGNAISSRPSISADGRRVAFTSASDNLSPDDTDGFFDVFVKDLSTGELIVVDRTADGTKAGGGSEGAAISADGLVAAFSSAATNLSPDATDGESHVYVKRLDTGTLTLADGGTFERPDEQIGASGPSLSADGGVVAFSTGAAGLDPADTDRRPDVYVRDLRTGVLRLASVTADGVKGDQPSTAASLSADGTRVAFETSSSNLAPEDADDTSDVYVKSLTDGTLRLASVSAAGVKANQAAGYPSLSADGLYLAFSTDATNLGIDTPPLVKQVYRKDLVSGELLPVSVATGGAPAGDYLSIDTSIATGGAVVAFMSPSTNLANDGGNRVADAFAKFFAVDAPPPPDTVAPTGEQVAAPSRLLPSWGTQAVVITGTARDDGGVASVSFAVVDSYGQCRATIAPVDGAGAPVVTWTRTVRLSRWLWPGDSARTYDITATVSDVAGNTTNVTTRVIVSWSR